MRDLAQQLLAVEAASQSVSLTHAPVAVAVAVAVCEKLRISLTRFAGADGFNSLMRRALALARVEVPALHAIQVKPDGSLEGLEKLAADPSNGGVEAAVAVTANLLGLLVTFVGKPIMLKLVREAWPESSLDEQHWKIEPL